MRSEGSGQYAVLFQFLKFHKKQNFAHDIDLYYEFRSSISTDTVFVTVFV